MKPQAWYVRAQRLDQSHKLASGPWESHGLAFAELARIRSRYQDADLSVVLHAARILPDAQPRVRGDVRAYDLAQVTERRAAASAIVAFVEGLGFTASFEDWDGEPDVSISVPALRATIWTMHTPAAPMPIISWFGSAHPLRSVLRGAWDGVGGYSKQTSKPDHWPALFDAIEIGLCAAVDGSAFE